MRNVQEMCGCSKGNVSVGKNLQKIRWNYQLLNSQTTSLNRWISLNILSSHLTLWFIQCHKNAICSKPSTLYDYVHPAVDVVATFFLLLSLWRDYVEMCVQMHAAHYSTKSHLMFDPGFQLKLWFWIDCKRQIIAKLTLPAKWHYILLANASLS